MRSATSSASLARTVVVLAVSASCGIVPSVAFPHRSAPAGYPVSRREELPGAFVTIPNADLAKALVGQRYRVRWGALELPDPDASVDARTGAFGFPLEGPFEQEIQVAAADVHVAVFAGDTTPGSPYRLLACVDVHPPIARSASRRTVVVLDVQPTRDAPALPIVVDAVTGEVLAVDTATLFDDQNAPCDARQHARLAWDENLRRRSRR